MCFFFPIMADMCQFSDNLSVSVGVRALLNRNAGSVWLKLCMLSDVDQSSAIYTYCGTLSGACVPLHINSHCVEMRWRWFADVQNQRQKEDLDDFWSGIRLIWAFQDVLRFSKRKHLCRWQRALRKDRCSSLAECALLTPGVKSSEPDWPD